MLDSEVITLQLPYLQDQESLTLRWRSFQDEVGSMSLWFLPIKPATTSIMYNPDQINFQLPDLHDLKLLMLR